MWVSATFRNRGRQNLSKLFSSENLSVGCHRTSRLLLHHLLHSALHLFYRWFSFVSADHPGIAVRIHDGAAAIAPEHIHHRALAGGTEFCRLIDDFVHVLHVKVETCGRSTNTLSCAFSHRCILWSEHERRAPQRKLGMNRLPVKTAHDSAFRETKGLLVEGHCSRNIGDRQHRRHGAVLLLVQRIDLFLCHSAPFLRTTF